MIDRLYAKIGHMDKEQIYLSMCEFSKDLFSKPLTRDIFENEKWPTIEVGLSVLHENGVLWVNNDPKIPYLYLRDGQAPRLKVNNGRRLFGMPRQVELDGEIFEKLPTELREAGIAALVAQLNYLPKLRNSQISIYTHTEPSGSTRIKGIVENMILREGIPVIRL